MNQNMNQLAGAMHDMLQSQNHFRENMQQYIAQHSPETIAEIIENQRRLTEKVDNITAFIFGKMPRK